MTITSQKMTLEEYLNYKRSEYAARGIGEYWIVAPMQGRIIVLEWVEGLYEERVFQGNERIISPMLPNLELTAEMVLNAGGT